MLLAKRSYFYFFIVSLVIISSIISMEKSPNRRLEKYHTFEAYLHSFSPGNINHGKPKILIIGGGLAYDDMVQGSETKFLEKITMSLEKKRPHYYPTNAYLVDLDGKWYSYADSTDYSSISDLQADISSPTKDGFSKEFAEKFDVIILEYLSYEALNGTTFKNCWSFLKKGGILIINNHISREPYVSLTTTHEDLSTKPNMEKFNISDTRQNDLTVFYPLAGAINQKYNKFYLFSPHPEVIKFVESNMSDLISNDYQIDLHNKIIKHARSEGFLEKVKGVYATLLPAFPISSIKIVPNIEHWYSVPDVSGYIVIEK